MCSYIKKHELELDEINDQSWLIALYIQKAVETAICNCFRKDGTEPISVYMEKPLNSFYSNYKKNNEKETNDINNYRCDVNYWSKLKKKGAL